MAAMILEDDLVRCRTYPRVSLEACQRAAECVGDTTVSGIQVPPETPKRDVFLLDLAKCKEFLAEHAAQRILKVVSPKDPQWISVGISSLHPYVINTSFICERVGADVCEVADLYRGSLFPVASGFVCAKLKAFNESFFSGHLDNSLVREYYLKFGGPQPQPTVHVDLYQLYQSTLSLGGYYTLPFSAIWERTGRNPNSNATHLRAIYRAYLFPYEERAVLGNMIFPAPLLQRTIPTDVQVNIGASSTVGNTVAPGLAEADPGRCLEFLEDVDLLKTVSPTPKDIELSYSDVVAAMEGENPNPNDIPPFQDVNVCTVFNAAFLSIREAPFPGMSEIAKRASSSVGTLVVCVSGEQQWGSSTRDRPDQRHRFYVDLVIHLRGTHGRERVFHGKEAPVDLFNLFTFVLEFGGFHEVLRENQVELVAEKLSSGSSLSPQIVIGTYTWLLDTYETRFLSLVRQTNS